jgi:hypothetical protein
MTSTTEPIIMGGSLSSGMGLFDFRNFGMKIVFVSQAMYPPAINTPTKMARKGREEMPTSNPRSIS